jgi:hypothetical protein
MVVFDYTSSDEEIEMEEDEDEDVAMILLMHRNKRPKRGGFVRGHEYIQRLRLDADLKLDQLLLGDPYISGEVFSTPVLDVSGFVQALCRVC